MPQISNFLPSTSGLHFPNSFPNNVPLKTIALKDMQIPLGSAANGLCGGMVFAVRDYFEWNLRPPQDITPPALDMPLFNFLVDRLISSFDLPFGPLRYLELMDPRRPGQDSWLTRVPLIPRSRAAVMLKDEWPLIKEELDNGRLCSIGLIRVKSSNPLDLGRNHHVLAYGYELNGNDLVINLYDPNHPDRDDVTMSLNIASPSKPVIVTQFPPEPVSVYCFIRTRYARSTAPPVAAQSPIRA